MSRIFRSRKRLGTLITLVLFIAALRKELLLPPDERTWSGELAGFVPYEFRVPNRARIKASWWNPDEDRILTPMIWGIGWTINVGRLARRFGLA